MPVNRKKKRKDPFRDSSSCETKPLRISAEAKRWDKNQIMKVPMDPHRPPLSSSHSCPVCQKYFSDRKKVKLHVQRVHKQIKDHKCDECEYRAHTKWDILRHIKTNHLPQDADPKDLRICPDCGKVLKVRNQRWWRKSALIWRNRSFKLKFWPTADLLPLQGNNHLNFHIKTKHLKLTKYSCDMCDFKSYGKYEIRSHIEIHHLPLGKNPQIWFWNSSQLTFVHLCRTEKRISLRSLLVGADNCDELENAQNSQAFGLAASRVLLWKVLRASRDAEKSYP